MKAAGTPGPFSKWHFRKPGVSVLARGIRLVLNKFLNFNESFDFPNGEHLFIPSLLVLNYDQVDKVSTPL